MSVKEIRPKKESLARRRRIVGRALREALSEQGDEFAGFALVTWDHRGNATSAFYADTGPIGESLVATFVHDQLVKHSAGLLTQKQLTFRETGE